MKSCQVTNEQWDAFLCTQRYSPFLQSSTMQQVHSALNHTTHTIAICNDSNTIVAVCLAVVVLAKRGKHVSVSYGPVIQDSLQEEQQKQALTLCVQELEKLAKKHKCAFIRLSPFWQKNSTLEKTLQLVAPKLVSAPLHLLAEHIWYLPLTQNEWQKNSQPLTAELLFMNLRKTTRNLVRRAEKEGVQIIRSTDPVRDLRLFLDLHEETRKRHKFTPYSTAFFTAQVEQMTKNNMCHLYLAMYNNLCISASIHVQFGQETSYHHGASSAQYSKIPASYLLQWQAICDALERNDAVYNFWGIAPVAEQDSKWHIQQKNHPFAGVTTFKTGFGGNVLPLVHCYDIPINWQYQATRLFEFARKWKRGF